MAASRGSAGSKRWPSMRSDTRHSCSHPCAGRLCAARCKQPLLRRAPAALKRLVKGLRPLHHNEAQHIAVWQGSGLQGSVQIQQQLAALRRGATMGHIHSASLVCHAISKPEQVPSPASCHPPPPISHPPTHRTPRSWPHRCRPWICGSRCSGRGWESACRWVCRGGRSLASMHAIECHTLRNTCLTRAARAGRAAVGCGHRGLGEHLRGGRRCGTGASGGSQTRRGRAHAQPARLWSMC